MRLSVKAIVIAAIMLTAGLTWGAGTPQAVNPLVEEGISKIDYQVAPDLEGILPSIDETDEVDTLWWTGNIDQHIFGGQTASWTTDLPQIDGVFLRIKYGLWNSPEVPLEIWVNNNLVGTVVALFGYISPGPRYAMANITNYIVDGPDLIQVVATGGNEAVIGYVGAGTRVTDAMLSNRVGVMTEPLAFELKSPAPNPFNPTTTLSFTLPEAALTHLTVYNVRGQQVAELIDDWRNAGYHQVTFDASNLVSGVYIYQLTAGDHRSVGKMMLVK